MNDHIPDVTKMINQWTNGTEILNVKPNGDFKLGNGVDPLVALGQLAKAFMQQQDRIKRLEDSYAAKDAQLSNLLHICRANGIDVSSQDLIHGKEAKP